MRGRGKFSNFLKIFDFDETWYVRYFSTLALRLWVKMPWGNFPVKKGGFSKLQAGSNLLRQNQASCFETLGNIFSQTKKIAPPAPPPFPKVEIFKMASWVEFSWDLACHILQYFSCVFCGFAYGWRNRQRGSLVPALKATLVKIYLEKHNYFAKRASASRQKHLRRDVRLAKTTNSPFPIMVKSLHRKLSTNERKFPKWWVASNLGEIWFVRFFSASTVALPMIWEAGTGAPSCMLLKRPLSK